MESKAKPKIKQSCPVQPLLKGKVTGSERKVLLIVATMYCLQQPRKVYARHSDLSDLSLVNILHYNELKVKIYQLNSELGLGLSAFLSMILISFLKICSHGGLWFGLVHTTAISLERFWKSKRSP